MSGDYGAGALRKRQCECEPSRAEHTKGVLGPSFFGSVNRVSAEKAERAHIARRWTKRARLLSGLGVVSRVPPTHPGFSFGWISLPGEAATPMPACDVGVE